MILEEIRAWTSGYCHHPGCCGWAYLIQYETGEGVFKVQDVGYDKGSTTHQMSLKAIWQAIKKINGLPDRMTDVVMLFSNDKRSVKCIRGIYNDCRTKVVASYLDEIGWAKARLQVTFLLMDDFSYMKENDIVNKMAMNIK
jgi:ribonuclease HI